MGAWTRLRDYMLSWQGSSIATFPAWVEEFATKLLNTVTGFTIGPTYEPDPTNFPGAYSPAAGVSGDKDGEFYLSSDLNPRQLWIWQGGVWWPITGGGAAPVPPSSEGYPKFEDDADITGLYREIVGQPFPTSVTWYTNAGKGTKVRELLVTRNAEQLPTQVQWKFYSAGVLSKTFTDVITYTPGTILEASRTRSVV